MKLLNNKWFAAFLLFIVSVAVFLPSLRNEFVWDDVKVIESSNYIFKAGTLTRVIIPAVSESKEALYYRPLIHASMVTDHKIWGESPFGFHLTNIIFHSLTTVVLYFLALILVKQFNVKRGQSVAFVSAAIFAVFPIHVESVSWVSGRTDIICGLFFVLAVLSHVLSFRNLLYLIIAGVSISLSLMSKEVAVTIPIVLVLLDIISARSKRADNILRYALYFGLAAVYLYLRNRAYINVPEVVLPATAAQAVQEIGSAGNFSQVLGSIKILLQTYFYYFMKLILPFNLNAFISAVPQGTVYLIASTVSIIVLLGVTSFSLIKKNRMLSFALMWILITLAPSALVAVLNIASTPLAERYLYIPSAGFCLLVGYLIFTVGARLDNKKASWLIAMALILSYAAITVNRQEVWKDRLSLWKDTASKSPGDAIPHINYGLALMDGGFEDEAIRELKISLDPAMNHTNRGRSITANNLGVVYINKEDMKNAEYWITQAYKYDPGYYKSNYHMGLIYFMKGLSENSEAKYYHSIQYINKALEIKPHYGRAYLLLANIYVQTGDLNKAKVNARLAIRSGLSKELEAKAQAIIDMKEQ